jgi:site-specific recombinase XerC
MLVADHLRVAAKKAGVVAPPRTFGFHTFRRTLASVLVRMKVDIKTVQEILRHQNLKTTLEVYAKAMSETKLEAQGMFLEELFNRDQKKKSAKDVVSARSWRGSNRWCPRCNDVQRVTAGKLRVI